jgi:LPPG:FO 2-phospho-L-lactate transferase
MPAITALCGGVGGAKLALGLAHCDLRLNLIVNTGDDFNLYGLPICPDLDTVTYTLAGLVHPTQGWGRLDESFAVQKELETLGETPWFQLGDKDIALHLLRARLLGEGARLTEATRTIRHRLGIACALLPMSDTPAATLVVTDEGLLTFQQYFVARRCQPVVRELRFGGMSEEASPEALAALSDPLLAGIVICPSNPLLSIAPILAVASLRHAIERRRAPAIAISPLIRGAAVKGPTAKIFQELGLAPSAVEVARQYHGLIDGFVLDETDAPLAPEIEALGIEVCLAQTLMTSLEDRIALARICLNFLERIRDRRPATSL